MFANGYVGTSEDSQRLRKLDKQREQQRKKFEELQDKKKREAAGLRQFGASKAEAYEAAFKTETVGLVTRKEFLEKRATIQERIEEDELQQRLQAEAAVAADKERRRKEKEKKRAKAKLSFAADVSGGFLIGMVLLQHLHACMPCAHACCQQWAVRLASTCCGS
jgi:protein FAM50